MKVEKKKAGLKKAKKYLVYGGFIALIAIVVVAIVVMQADVTRIKLKFVISGSYVSVYPYGFVVTNQYKEDGKYVVEGYIAVLRGKWSGGYLMVDYNSSIIYDNVTFRTTMRDLEDILERADLEAWITYRMKTAYGEGTYMRGFYIMRIENGKLIAFNPDLTIDLKSLNMENTTRIEIDMRFFGKYFLWKEGYLEIAVEISP